MSGLITAVVLFVIVFIVIPVLFKMVFDPEFWLTPDQAAYRRVITLQERALAEEAERDAT